MKQLLFLLLFPCLAMAQYQGNAGQKITLGEQTTADGLVWRGRTSDTVNLMTNKIDTSAYLVLDTITEAIWLYRASTTPKWNRVVDSLNNLQGTLSVAKGGTGVTSFNPNNYLIRTNASGVFDTSAIFEAAGNVGIGTNTPKVKLQVKDGSLIIGDVVPNDYDNATTPGFNIGVVSTTGASRAMNLVHYAGTTASAAALVRIRRSRGTSIGDYTKVENDDVLGNINWMYSNGTTWATGASINASMDGTTTTGSSFPTRLQFYTTNSGSVSQSVKMTIKNNGNLGIGNESPSEALHVTGNARITAVGAGAYANDLNITSTGVLTTASSDEKYKYNILPINYGLETILQLKPVNFQWIKGEEQDLGFIAQDVAEIIPEAVDTNWNSDLLMRYESIIPILTKAIQEQQALIKALEQRILILENK